MGALQHPGSLKEKPGVSDSLLCESGVYAALTTRAEDWRWSSLWRWPQPVEPDPALLSPWPILRSPPWVARVNEALADGEFTALRRSARRGSPFGDTGWIESTAERPGLATTLNPRGRPQVRLKPNQKTTSPAPFDFARSHHAGYENS